MDIRAKRTEKLSGVIQAPPSKSYTHRALYVAATIKKESVLVNPCFCEDNIATMRFFARLGCTIIVEGEEAQKLVEQGHARPLPPREGKTEGSVIRMRGFGNTPQI